MERLSDILGKRPAETNVAVIGDALIDYQYWVDEMPPVGGDTLIHMSNRSAGGSAANTAVALNALGVSTAFIGRIGSDENGDWIKSQLASGGVDISCVQYGASSGYVVTIINATGERTMFSYRGASAIPMIATPILSKTMRRVKIMLLSGYCLLNPEQAGFSLMAIEELKAAGGLFALDPSPLIGQVEPGLCEKILSSVDILMPNRSELMTLAQTDQFAQALETMQKRIPVLALKLGSEGAAVFVRKGMVTPSGTVFPEDLYVEVPAEPVQIVDTTGAGDAFNAGFISGYLESPDPKVWLGRGNQAAAAIVSQKGARLKS